MLLKNKKENVNIPHARFFYIKQLDYESSGY